LKKIFWITLVIVFLAAYLASANPDGLDFVSQKLGFAGKGLDRSALLAGYSFYFLPSGALSTALAGVVGILIIILIFRLVVTVLKPEAKSLGSKTKRSRDFQSQGPFCLLLLTMILASPLFAASPLITDDIYTVPAGRNEMELTYDALDNLTKIWNIYDLSLKRGLTNNLDLGIEIPYSTLIAPGLNDIYLHAKYRFWEKRQDEGLTARMDYKFKNADVSQGLGSGDNDYWLLLIYSRMFGRTKTHLNLGYVNVGVNAGRTSDDYWAYTFAVENPFWGEKGDIVAECVANTSALPNPAFIQLGVRYAIQTGLKVDTAYSFGLNSNSLKNNLAAGLHWDF